MSIGPDDSRHGTTNGYSNLGCRCDRCRSAWSAYVTEKNHRFGRCRPRSTWLAELRLREPPAHGTESRYNNNGCRCAECKKASREARARRRAKVAA